AIQGREFTGLGAWGPGLALHTTSGLRWRAVQLQEWTARRKEALRRPDPLNIRNVTPSIRDFTHAVSTQRGPLAVGAEIAGATPEEGGRGSGVDAPWVAGVREGCLVSGVAVATAPVACKGPPRDLQVAASATSGPVVARDLVLSRDQLYEA